MSSWVFFDELVYEIFFSLVYLLIVHYKYIKVTLIHGDFYPATLLNLFITSSSFFVNYLGFSIYNIISCVNNDSFTSTFLIWMRFISSSYLITVARTSSTMLNMSGESRGLWRRQQGRWELNPLAHAPTTGTPRWSSKEQSEQPMESQLIWSLKAKYCRGCLKVDGKVI